MGYGPARSVRVPCRARRSRGLRAAGARRVEGRDAAVGRMSVSWP